MGERMGRPTAVIELSGEERETLERWARSSVKAVSISTNEYQKVHLTWGFTKPA